MTKKRCSKCKQFKPFESFYRNRAMADGRANQCIDCFKETHKRYRDSEKGKARQAAYDASPSGKDVHARANRKWKKSRKGKESYRRYYKRHKKRNRARGRVFDAVRSGRMPTASELFCVACGKQATEYHHHLGYSDKHSFSVIPVCKPCHVILDKN